MPKATENLRTAFMFYFKYEHFRTIKSVETVLSSLKSLRARDVVATDFKK